MSYLNKNRKQTDLVIAFLRSNGECVYCGKSYDATFEFEHIYADKDDSKALLACSLCNRYKATKTLIDFVRGNTNKVAEIEARLQVNFSDYEIENAIKYIAQLTVKLTIEANRSLTLSDIRFICTPKARMESLPNGLKIDLTRKELDKFAKYYDTKNLDIYITQSE